MTRTLANIAAAVAVLMLYAPGIVSACPLHGGYRRGFRSGRAPMFIGREERAPATQFGAPDFTVQYGYVANPGMTSGSLGAMLQGRNPAAGALP
jgi:hypothetical protein